MYKDLNMGTSRPARPAFYMMIMCAGKTDHLGYKIMANILTQVQHHFSPFNVNSEFLKSKEVNSTEQMFAQRGYFNKQAIPMDSIHKFKSLTDLIIVPP